MSDAAGELAEALELLHLMDLCQRRLAFTGALLHPSLELGIRHRQLGSPLLDTALELRVQALELPSLSIKIDEYPHLRAKQIGNDRNWDVVDAAGGIALQ